jgi:hypothetical protein
VGIRFISRSGDGRHYPRLKPAPVGESVATKMWGSASDIQNLLKSGARRGCD